MGLAENQGNIMGNDSKKIKTNKYRACKQFLILNLSRDNIRHCLRNMPLSAWWSDE